jgi:hypothetical protein
MKKFEGVGEYEQEDVKKQWKKIEGNRRKSKTQRKRRVEETKEGSRKIRICAEKQEEEKDIFEKSVRGGVERIEFEGVGGAEELEEGR